MKKIDQPCVFSESIIKINQYEHMRLIIVDTCFPFCAFYALQKRILDNKHSFPLDYDAILSSFFMDNYFASVLMEIKHTLFQQISVSPYNKVVSD